jgi:hypothetical protein
MILNFLPEFPKEYVKWCQPENPLKVIAQATLAKELIPSFSTKIFPNNSPIHLEKVKETQSQREARTAPLGVQFLIIPTSQGLWGVNQMASVRMGSGMSFLASLGS